MGEDTHTLAGYNDDKAYYRRESEAITDRKEATDEKVAKPESGVKSILPENANRDVHL